MLFKILKFRLKQRTNKSFVKWRAEHKKLSSTELHHLLGSFIGGKKQNDYLLAEIPEQMHKDIHYKKPLDDDEFTSEFCTSLEYVFDYIEYLEQKLNKYDIKPVAEKIVAKIINGIPLPERKREWR